MNITIAEADGLADSAYLSVRVGETRRMRPFRSGESFSFSGQDGRGFVQLDAFEKLGSHVTSALAELGIDSGAKETTQDVSIQTTNGAISAKLKVQLQDPASPKKSLTRHKLAVDAKNYLDLYDVWGTIQSMLHAILKQRPEDPTEFMLNHLAASYESRSGRPWQPPQREANAEEASMASSEAKPWWGRPSIGPALLRFPRREADLHQQAKEALLSAAQNGGLENYLSPLKEAAKARDAIVAAASSGSLKAYLEAERGPVFQLSKTIGLGHEECGGFPADICPEQIADLSEHHSIMADVLSADPSIYGSLRSRRTTLGVPFAKCIKSGMDNPGHPLLKIVGVVAGDEECYDTFSELFDPIIDARHGGYGRSAMHHTDLAAERVTQARIDPSGKYAMSVRVRSSRSLRGIRFPPACDRAERRKAEEVLVNALGQLGEEDLRGAYFPLRGSTSHAAKPGGMSDSEEKELAKYHFIFQEPDSSVLLCSGIGRHWPEGRGVFAANSHKVVVWLNEEDHLRLISLQKGDDVRAAFSRFSQALKGVERGLKQQGHAFAHSPHLGYLSSCPSNLGTGLRASVMLRIPLLSAHPRFQGICRSLGLQESRCTFIAPSGGNGQEHLWDIANRIRLGTSEVDLVNAVIIGCGKLVAMEQALERGEEPPDV